MNNDFVYQSVLDLSMQNGSDQSTAKSCALNAVNEFRQGKTYGRGRPLDLIEHHVKLAAGITGKKRVKAKKTPARAYRKRKDTPDMF